MRSTITTADTRPRPEAVAIGKALEACPPWGYQARYSAWAWAHLAEGVLRAQEQASDRESRNRTHAVIYAALRRAKNAPDDVMRAEAVVTALCGEAGLMGKLSRTRGS